MAVKTKKLTVSEVEAETIVHTKNAENRMWDLELVYRPLFHERYDVPVCRLAPLTFERSEVPFLRDLIAEVDDGLAQYD